MQNQTVQRYFFNSSWMLAEQILRILSGVFVGIYIARYLGPEQFGMLTYVLAISTFILCVARLGMDAVLIKELVNTPEKNKELMGTAFWLMMLAALTCYIVAALGISLTDEINSVKIYAYIVSASTFFTSFLVVDYFFQSQIKAKYSAICKTLALLCMSIAKLALIFSDAEIFWFAIASLLDHVVLAVFLLFAALRTREINFLGHFNLVDAKLMLKSSWPMVITAVASLVFMRIDQVMIRSMLGLHELGIYSAAVKVYESWIILPYVITISLLPAIVKLKQGDEQNYHRKLCQLFRAVIWLSVVAAFFVSLLSTPIMTIAFGSQYTESASVLSIVMWTAVFASMSSVSARYFNAENMEKKIALRTAIAAAVNIALNLLLIPRYGIEGAAIATFCCIFFTAYLMDWMDKDLRVLLKIKHHAIFFMSTK
ncbi:flippase [Pseudomonas sp. BF-R-30]|uniref:flippase n=1 Tax=Pseudomonas sp. BF-R-30 TaxID=2832384 RepID=UPI001CBC9799|nr:flippase [Pseudomonas sp. BF-R-30]